MAKKEYEAKVEQAKKDLNAIINEETQWTLEEQKARVEEIEKKGCPSGTPFFYLIYTSSKVARPESTTASASAGIITSSKGERCSVVPSSVMSASPSVQM